MKSRKFARRQDRTALNHIWRWLAALAAMYVILVLPDHVNDLGSFLSPHLPLELSLMVLVLVAVSGRAGAWLRGLIIFALTVTLLFKVANMAAFFGFDRPFNPLEDVLMVPTVLDTLGKAAGTAVAYAAVVGAALVLGLIVAAMTWATGVVVHGLSENARLPVAAAVLGSVALAFTPYATYTSWSASLFVRDQAVAVSQGLRDAAQFRAQLVQDPFGNLPPESRLAGLKGTDVLLIFIESYGRASLDNPAYAQLLRGTLKKFNDALAGKGFSARSAWLASPTFGGESYLAHSTTMSGLWVENQQRYVQLLRSHHDTLISDFNGAGWHTVAVMPEITMPWPEASFFKYGKIYIAPDLNYKGEPFDYVTMPDQYVLSAFHGREMAPAERKPVMAEIALISSHIPWVPVPKLVPWEDVGDGTIFNTARTTEDGDEIWRDPKRIAEYYAMSVDYTLQTLMSYVTTLVGDHTLLIIMGDHEPMSFIAGDGASHEVPAHIIARDPALLDALGEGKWTPGMEPDATSPSWPMNAVRERLLSAFAKAPDAAVSSPEDAPDAAPVQPEKP